MARSTRYAPAQAAPPPASLWRPGCLGAILGVVLAVAGLLALIALTAAANPLPARAPNPSQADIVITVQEAYLAQAVAQALPPLPSGLASDVRLDLKPNNRILFLGRLRSTLLPNLEGNVSGVIYLGVTDGKLSVRFGDLSVLGFALPAIGNTLANDMVSSMDDLINDQMRAGLGQDIQITSLSSDEQQLVLQARGR
jgi:hypothetical protein